MSEIIVFSSRTFSVFSTWDLTASTVFNRLVRTFKRCREEKKARMQNILRSFHYIWFVFVFFFFFQQVLVSPSQARWPQNCTKQQSPSAHTRLFSFYSWWRSARRSQWGRGRWDSELIPGQFWENVWASSCAHRLFVSAPQNDNWRPRR